MYSFSFRIFIDEHTDYVFFDPHLSLTHTLAHLICDVVMQNILRLDTNAESMHMFDLQ